MRQIDADILKSRFVPHQYYSAEAILQKIDSAQSIQPIGPRVLTLEEIKEARICWIEDHTEIRDLLYPAIYLGKGNGEAYMVFLVDEDDDAFDGADYPDSERWLEPGDINIVWRPWDSKPTPEQMEAAEWE